uniref:Putative tick kunitz 56 n=1 Tax=Ixodes ricinus TaxID=34613 RepID=V5H6A7_IXORI
MKSIVGALCFLAIVVYCTAMLLEEQCRAPHPFVSCDGNVPLRYVYYFNNGTNQCERDYTCARGTNNFEDIVCCMTECPYGNHHPPGKRGSGRKY